MFFIGINRLKLKLSSRARCAKWFWSAWWALRAPTARPDRCDGSARTCVDFARKCFDREGPGNSFAMIILGVVLLLLGFVLSIPILWTIGLILLIVGAVLMLLGRGGRQVGGRAHYW